MTRPTLTTRTTRGAALAASALSAVLLLAACGDASTTSSAGAAGGAGSSSGVSQDAPFNDVDVAFVKDMNPHHAQAVEMADLVLAAGPSPAVADLAQRIRAAQTPEIAELEALAAAFGIEGDEGGHGGHSMSGMSMGGGMMSMQDMAALEAATGAEASRLFLEGMVMHHQGALQMAEAELAGGENPDAKDLAARIKAAQQAEIAEMQQLLEEL